MRRIPSQKPAQEIGAEPVRALAEARTDCQAALDIVPADGKYGNAGFLERVEGLRVSIVARLRRDRVLYRAAPPESAPRRGRPRKHGNPFAFQDASTWGESDEVVEFDDEHYGKVCLQRWNHVHERRAPTLVDDVVCASVHLEREQSPEAIWLAWRPPGQRPAGIAVTAQTIWSACANRWPIEPGMRFRKETLGWTLPRFQRAETGDTWTYLMMLADWILFLARPLVADTPLPWPKPQSRLTPQRVRQSLKPIFVLIGSPARAPKTRGTSPGWPKGRRRTPKPRHNVVKKGVPAAQTT